MAHDDICPCRHQRLVCRGQCEECLAERLAVVLHRLGTILAADALPAAMKQPVSIDVADDGRLRMTALRPVDETDDTW